MEETKMKFVAAMGSMKGSLSAKEASRAVGKGIEEGIRMGKRILGRRAEEMKYEIIERPVADGGDDTLDAIAERIFEKEVKDPVGRKKKARWGNRGDTAVIEMAQASGISLLKPEELDPFKTTTFGTGELIKEAIERGYKKILLTIGGSATVDGGIGALGALGAEFFDEEGKIIEPKGNEATGRVKKVEFKKMKEKMKGVEMKIACDVENPLFGEKGAAAIFGPQKVNPKIRMKEEELKEIILRLENNLKNFNKWISEASGKDISKMKGAGAAGGFPIGFCGGINAKMERGSELVLDLLKFDELRDSRIVFTSEGRCDGQTLEGKTPFAVCKRMKRHEKSEEKSEERKRKAEVIVLCGGIENKEVEERMIEAGATLVMPICDEPMSLERSQRRARELIER